MYLSRLEISGFKSFPERTTLDFNGGVTAVVGPNGCGKTNILDSIRWALGEQRSGLLRSSKMEELIFNGTSQLKATGLAEVHLTIKNDKGVLPLEYDEVVITRRLFRNGESEYCLNKIPCRLKDILELFYDTGMGAHAYSVIQQGMIDAILSDKTEDRRALFDEAAGVTKYKHRKKEAINKLEATDADLLRLGDIIIEIEKQVGLLRRQAARARKYNSDKDKLKNLELVLAAAMLLESQEKYKDLGERKKEAQLKIEAVAADIEKFELSLNEIRLRSSEVEREATAQRQLESDLSLKAADFESEIKLNKHRIESSTKDIENYKSEVIALKARIESLQRNIENNASRDTENQKEKNDLIGKSAELDRQLTDLLNESRAAEISLEEKRDKNSDIAGKMSGLRAEMISISEMKKSLEMKISDIEIEVANFDKNRNERQDGLTSLESKRTDLETEIERAKDKQQRKTVVIGQAEDLINRQRENLSKARAEFSGLKARQELLGQLIDSGEGYSNGARALLSWSDKPSGMLAPFAEVLDVPESYRVAVTAALNEMSEVVPVKTIEDAQNAINYLKENNGGRASFLVLDRISDDSANIQRPSSAQGFIGFLDDITTFPDEYKSAVNLLLHRIALFDSEKSALNADGEWQYFTRVTLEGLVIEPSGVLSGGNIVPSLVGRRQDLNQIIKRSSELAAEIEKSETELRDNMIMVESMRREQVDLEKKKAQLEDEKKRLEAELGQLRFDFKENETRHSAAIDQVGKLREEIASYEQKIARIKGEVESLEISSLSSSGEFSLAMQSVEKNRATIQTVEKDLTSARIKVVELDGLSMRLSSEIEHGKELIAEANRLIESHEANTIRAHALIDELKTKNDALELELYNLFAERRDIQKKALEIEGSLAEMTSGTGKIEDDLSHRRKDKDKLTSDFHALEMEYVESESARRSIVEKLKMEFNISNVEPAPLPEGQTPELIRQQTDEIRLGLQRMEPLNLLAAEDYDREKDRLDFLLRQRDDLMEAKASLKEAITKINLTAIDRFNETFNKIKENFYNVFTGLFEGGEAHVELEDTNEPLDSPIKIMARPGGKKMLSVTQLSGGERALTAISLLFAIYLVKPSPFCILDEVDAPLDDANLMRFIKLIKQFSNNTQFIIITHNKITMEASDILYGVTMETPGVSKVVSVKLGGNGNRIREYHGVE